MTPGDLTFRQRWATWFTIALTVAAFGGGLLLKSSSVNATRSFEDRVTGVIARYPAAWLLERGTAASDFVFRVQDTAALAFKTSLSVSILPVGGNATVYDVAQILTVRRAQSLSSYRTLTITPTQLPNGAAATRVEYAYAASENNPFLQSLPVVVHASDIIVLTKGQALVATFQSDAQTFAANQHYFDDFLRRLQY